MEETSENDGILRLCILISASNESKSCLHDLDECREGQMPRNSATGYLT